MISKNFVVAASLSLSIVASGCMSHPRPENSIEALAYWHDCMDEEFFDTGRISFSGHYTVGMTREEGIDLLISRCSRELDQYEQALIAEGETEEDAAAAKSRLYHDLRDHLLAVTSSRGSQWSPNFR